MSYVKILITKIEQAFCEQSVPNLHVNLRQLWRSDTSMSAPDNLQLKHVLDKHLPNLDPNVWMEIMRTFQGFSQQEHLVVNMWINSFPDAQHVLSQSVWHTKAAIQHLASAHANMLHACLMSFPEKERLHAFVSDFGLYDFWKSSASHSWSSEKNISITPFLASAGHHCPQYVRQEVLEHIKDCQPQPFAPPSVTDGLVFVAEQKISFSFVEDCMNVLSPQDHGWIIDTCQKQAMLEGVLQIPSIHSAYERMTIQNAVTQKNTPISKSKM